MENGSAMNDCTAALGALRKALYDRTIARRDFIRRAAALGVAAPAAAAMARVYGADAAPDVRATVSARQQDASPTPGGTLRYGRALDSDNLDPVTNDGNVNIWVFTNVYDQLLRVNADGTALEPALAESYEVSQDGLTYTFHLRQGVKFSDGTPLKASDVVYSLTRAANDPGQTWTFTLTALKRAASSDPNKPGDVQGITAPDDSTVMIELAQPWAPFLSDLAMFNCSIVSEAFTSPDPTKLTQQMFGTGPFMQQSWEKGVAVTLVKNPNYWEAGLPYLDSVVLTVIPDDNARILQLQGGDFDAIYDVPSARVQELKGDANLNVIEFPSTFSAYVTLNNRDAPLNDVHARLALQYATDKQTLIQVVLNGVGTEATTFMPKGAQYWNPNLPGFPFDLAKAKDELSKSATPNGFKISVTYVAGDAESDQLGAALKDMWNQIGVDLELNPVEQSVWTDSYRQHTFQAMFNSWTNDIIDPDELVSYAVLPESSQAFQTGWSNAEAVDLAKKGATELDPDKRQEIYFRIQELYNQDSPMVLLYHKPYIDVTTTKVHDLGHPPTGQWVFKKTWIEQ